MINHTEFHRRLLARQVDELFRFAPAAVALSFIGSIAMMLVFWDTGELQKGLFWMVFATMVMFFRTVTTCAYRLQTRPVARPEKWAHLMTAGNFLAGLQWCLIGTLLFPAEHNYREFLTVIVLAIYVAGSVVAFSPVRWAHLALAIPASVPPAIYIFFMHAGINWIGGGLAFGFIGAVLFFSHHHHGVVTRRLQSELEQEDRQSALRGPDSTLGAPGGRTSPRTVARSADLLSRSNRLATSL